jgi:DNA polymerase III alpha subunit
MIKTGHSFKIAVGHLSDVVARMKEIDWTVAPIADRTSTYGFVEFDRLAREAGLRPVFGVELGAVERLGEKKPAPDYWVFLARERIRDLSDAIATATQKNRKTPALLYSEAIALPGLVKIAGPRSKVVEPAPDLYFGLSPATPIGLYRAARKAGHPFLALPANLFPREGDREFYRIVVGPKRQEMQTWPQWIVSDEEWRRALWFAAPEDLDAAIENRERALGECRAELKRADLLSPPRTKTLREMCEAGALRTGTSLADPVYAARLDRELAMIEEKKFADYFYILADLISYSKTKMVVGPARGSSCGSLVCYLLDITSIDPIPFGLIFERFIDVNRADLPDVDIDFSDERRDIAFEYMEKVYGREHVARLGTVNTYQPKSAMNTAAIALRVPQDAVDDVANVLIKRSQGDNRASSTLEDTLATTDAGRRLMARFPEMAISARMEEHPASAGRHAAGVVVTKTPVRDYVAVDSRTNATMCDKRGAEVLNLLKIDALGLTQLSIFERVAEFFFGSIGDGDYRKVNDWLGSIPLDDAGAFRILNEKHFAGIFQFSSGSALAHFVEDMVALKPNPIDSIEDVVALTALIRPGPLSSGGAMEWMHRRCGRSAVVYPHPLLEPYLRDSLGIVIYQEQILRIGRELGNLSWEDVTKLRQAMSKSLGKEYFDQFGDRWKAGSIDRGLPPEVADRFWADMVGFGAWAFNRAHSVAYGLVSYWSCYLKAQFPIEYAAATLDAESAKPESQIAVLRELEKEGVGYVPVDPVRSGRKWEIDGRRLVGPLINIEHVGPATVEKILQARASNCPIGSALEKRLANPKTKIDSLYPIRDAIATIDLPALQIYSPIVPISSVSTKTTDRVLVVGVFSRVAQKDENTMVAVQRRGGRVLTSGPTISLQLFLRDDSGDIFAKISRYDFDRLGKPVLAHGRIGKAIWAISGTVPFSLGIRMLMVENIRYVGDLDENGRRASEPPREESPELSLAVN